MKLLIFLWLIAIGSLLNAGAYEVENGKQQGFTVSADNFVYITTSTGEKIQVTQITFVTPEYSIPPVEPILCTWDPSHTWLGIFITVKQITEIHLFNLQTNSLLKADPTFYKYPDSFNKSQSFAHTKPLKWSGNKLFADTYVKFRDGDTKHFPVTIIINGDTFQIIPN